MRFTPVFAEQLRSDAAAKAAHAWFDQLGRSGSARATTVSTARTMYVRHLKPTRWQRAAKDADGRFEHYALNHAKIAATGSPKPESSGRLTPSAIHSIAH